MIDTPTVVFPALILSSKLTITWPMLKPKTFRSKAVSYEVVLAIAVFVTTRQLRSHIPTLEGLIISNPPFSIQARASIIRLGSKHLYSLQIYSARLRFSMPGKGAGSLAEGERK